MKNISLDRVDVNYLLNSHLDKNVINKIERGLNETNFRVNLEIEMDAISDILEYLTDEFSKHGLGSNDEPNSEGLKIEALIDKFAREFYNP